MKNLIFLFVIVVMIGMISCDSKNSEAIDVKEGEKIISQKQESEKEIRSEQPVDLESTTPDINKIGSLRISDIEIIPSAPTIDSTLSVNVKLSQEKTEDIEFEYRFWKNAEKIKEGKENILSPRSFKKKDFIFVDVILIKDDKEIFRKRSDMVQILNSSPVIKEIKFPEILGSGTYKTEVIAEDNDGDPLTFSIEGENIPLDITIDSNKGVITYPISTPPPEEVKFFVVVKDNDQGVTKQEIKIKGKSFFHPEK